MIKTILCLILVSSSLVTYAQKKVKISDKIVTIQDITYFKHKVQRKQTIDSIAVAYGVTKEDIYKSNPTLKTKGLRVRKIILIPQIIHSEIIKDSVLKKIETLTPIIKKDTLPEVYYQKLTNYKVGEVVDCFFLFPFGRSKKLDQSGVEFYNGMLVSLEEFRAKGYKINLKVYSTFGDVQKTQQIIDSGKLDGADIIIGPIFKESLELVVLWAKINNAAVISPLNNSDIDEYNLIDMPPIRDNKMVKLNEREIDIKNNNVIVVNYPGFSDQKASDEFYSVLPFNVIQTDYISKREREKLLEDSLARLDLEYFSEDTIGATGIKSDDYVEPHPLEVFMFDDRKNIVVVPIRHQGAVEEVLSWIITLNSPIKKYDIKIIGPSSWRSLPSLNPEQLFIADIIYPTSYYSDRGDIETREFYNIYMNKFKSLPSLFSMRGYDVMDLILPRFAKYGDRAFGYMLNKIYTPLQTPYRFNKTVKGKLFNDQWVVVNNTPRFKINTY